MKRVIFVFTHESEHDVSNSGFFLNKLGTDRILRLSEMLKQSGQVDLGRIKIFAESMTSSNLNAELFGELHNIDPSEIELYSDDCDGALTLITLFMTTHETLVFFGLVGSTSLFQEYSRMVRYKKILAKSMPAEMYASGKILALVIDLEKRIPYRILIGEERRAQSSAV